jgi:hypothetical protein
MVPVVPIVVVTLPLEGVTRLGEQALALHVGADVANVPLAWHKDVAVPVSV